MKRKIAAAFAAVACAALPFNRTGADYSAIARKMGYEGVEPFPCETVEIVIPKSFNTVYEKYNELLKQGGYDLTPYCGKRCTRYTYLIDGGAARLNVIVCEGKLIGGDICSLSIDGVMIPIQKELQKE